MDTKTIKRQLWTELESLRDTRGFVKAGLPRFDRLFGRDSLIVSWQLLQRDPQICRKTLEILSQCQGGKVNRKSEEEPGKILHEHEIGRREHPKGYFSFPYYGSVDATPLFLILWGFYAQKTEDKGFLKKHWKHMLSALGWMENYGDVDGDGFLEYERKNPRGLFHQGWKDGFEDHLRIRPPVAIVEVQGYQYLALQGIARLAEVFGHQVLKKKLLQKAKKLKRDFNKKFWMEDKKYFALALNGSKKQRRAITSNPGHLLFTGIIDQGKVDVVVKRLFEKDLWTPYGMRTHSTKEPDFDPRSYHLGSVWPHDNWIIAQGLKKLGYKSEYQKIKNALLGAYEKTGFIPEFYGVFNNKIILEMEKPICHPQAWATGALLHFLSS